MLLDSDEICVGPDGEDLMDEAEEETPAKGTPGAEAAEKQKAKARPKGRPRGPKQDSLMAVPGVRHGNVQHCDNEQMRHAKPQKTRC